jgi:hypothetical protein
MAARHAAATNDEDPAAVHRQVRTLVDLLTSHLEAERVDAEARTVKLQAWEEQQQRMLEAVAQAQQHREISLHSSHTPPSPSAVPVRQGTVASSAASDILTYSAAPPGRHPYAKETNGPSGYAAATAADQAAAAKTETLSRKCEHLVRTLIKTLRENRAYEETVLQLTAELTSTRERLVTLQDVAGDRDALAAELRAAQEILRQRNDDISRLRAELRHRAAALERQAVAERESRQAVQGEKEAVLLQVSQQMADLVSEHEVLLDTNEEMFFACERASTDLRQAVRRGKEFEARALAAERALEQERLAHAHRASDAVPAVEPATAEGEAGECSVPELRGRIARLEARLRAESINAADKLRRKDDAAAEALEARDAAEQRAAEQESVVRSLKRELANAVRDATHQALAAQSARQRLLAVKHDALAVTNLMSVTRVDTEHIGTLYRENAEATNFVDRVTMDLTNLANFLALLRALETEPPPIPSATAGPVHGSLLAHRPVEGAPYRGESPAISPRREVGQSRFIAPPAFDDGGHDEFRVFRPEQGRLAPAAMNESDHVGSIDATLKKLDAISEKYRGTRGSATLR